MVEKGNRSINDAAVDGGGIILKGGSKKITWDNANKAWQSNKKFTFA